MRKMERSEEWGNELVWDKWRMDENEKERNYGTLKDKRTARKLSSLYKWFVLLLAFMSVT